MSSVGKASKQVIAGLFNMANMSVNEENRKKKKKLAEVKEDYREAKADAKEKAREARAEDRYQARLTERRAYQNEQKLERRAYQQEQKIENREYQQFQKKDNRSYNEGWWRTKNRITQGQAAARRQQKETKKSEELLDGALGQLDATKRVAEADQLPYAQRQQSLVEQQEDLIKKKKSGEISDSAFKQSYLGLSKAFNNTQIRDAAITKEQFDAISVAAESIYGGQ